MGGTKFQEAPPEEGMPANYWEILEYFSIDPSPTGDGIAANRFLVTDNLVVALLYKKDLDVSKIKDKMIGLVQEHWYNRWKQRELIEPGRLDERYFQDKTAKQIHGLKKVFDSDEYLWLPLGYLAFRIKLIDNDLEVFIDAAERHALPGGWGKAMFCFLWHYLRSKYPDKIIIFALLDATGTRGKVYRGWGFRFGEWKEEDKSRFTDEDFNSISDPPIVEAKCNDIYPKYTDQVTYYNR